MNSKNKSKKQVNPEIIREQEEKRRSQGLYDDEPHRMLLYPWAFLDSTVSSTESRGLIQTIPPTPDVLGVFDDPYNYRRTEPVVEEDDE